MESEKGREETQLTHFLCNVPFLNPLKTSEMGKIPFHCKPCYQLKFTFLRFSLFRFQLQHKKNQHPPCKFLDQICDKEQKEGIPFFLFVTDLTYQLKQRSHYEIHLNFKLDLNDYHKILQKWKEQRQNQESCDI